MSQDSTVKTVGVATGICLFCSLFVSIAAVKLKPRQIKNQKLDKIKNILQVANLADTVGKSEYMALYQERINPVMIELSSGDVLDETQFNDVLNLESFDIQVFSGLPDYSQALDAETDIAGIRRQPLHMIVYQLLENNAVEKLILPIYGKGLWSTLYGFLALEKDLTTVSGITFYQHGETPGLGGEVDNPNWKGGWQGKQAFDDGGDVIIEIIKGKVIPGSPGADHQVDGLSGATLTARGVDNLVKFWLGENGYGPYLKQIREDR
ncbi:MAG: Na(+)-translocating NADH-quinone reductase subunit C [Planctomycetes bacterium]|nr:Na(+)-translocating NADH-quinone reductase subunit C [Planctomycetota bacterium]